MVAIEGAAVQQALGEHKHAQQGDQGRAAETGQGLGGVKHARGDQQAGGGYGHNLRGQPERVINGVLRPMPACRLRPRASGG